MYEKVNPSHPDKIADRIAGAIVDYAYSQIDDPKIAVEVLIGHGDCHVIIESNLPIEYTIIKMIVDRITGTNKIHVDVLSCQQDKHLAGNQINKIRCGDNGIFKGMPITAEQQSLSNIAGIIYNKYKTDGKHILSESDKKLIVCQSNATIKDLEDDLGSTPYNLIINPLGYWTGGTGVDTGATNRKLGSDMGDAVTGGGLHGKDLSKADVSVNIYAHLKAQELNAPVELYCAIGDEYVDGKPYYEIVEIARNYINAIGGFEKLAEWGLI